MPTKYGEIKFRTYDSKRHNIVSSLQNTPLSSDTHLVVLGNMPFSVMFLKIFKYSLLVSFTYTLYCLGEITQKMAFLCSVQMQLFFKLIESSNAELRDTEVWLCSS